VHPDRQDPQVRQGFEDRRANAGAKVTPVRQEPKAYRVSRVYKGNRGFKGFKAFRVFRANRAKRVLQA
jgi:hypothetical protein